MSRCVSPALTCFQHSLVLMPEESVSQRPFQGLDVDREATDPEV